MVLLAMASKNMFFALSHIKDDDMRNIVRIVPPAVPTNGSSYVTTQGTKFVLPNGSELGGVQRAKIMIDTDSIYRCTLELIGCTEDQFCEIAQVTFKQPPLWTRVIEWITGNSVRDVTDLSDVDYRRYEKFEMAKSE